MIRFGVAGLSFGQFHVQTLANLPGAKVAAVADLRQDVSDRIADQYGAKPFYDGTEMVRSGEIDALTICLPPAFRGDILKAAVERELPLFVEKPWSTNVKHGEELARITAASKAPVMTGFSFRFHPAVEKLRKLIAGDLGPVLAAQGSYLFDFLPPAERWLWDPENGGGLFNENSCHLIDLVCDLMGTPKKVKASGGIWFDRPSEEAAAVSLDFSSGAVASLLVGGIGAAGNHDFPSLTLYCRNGEARLKGRNHTWQELEWVLRGEKESRRLSAEPEQLGRTRYSDSMELFIEVISQGKEVPSPVADGLLSVRMAEAIYASIRKDQSILLE